MAKRKAAPKKRRGPAKRGPGRSKRRTYTRNPTARGILEGTGIQQAARALLPMVGGALAAKVSQKRFGDKTSETGTWTMRDYIAGFLGSLVASYGARHVLKSTASTQQKVLEGGLLVLAFKAITTALVPMSDTMKEWLGDDGQVYRPGNTFQSTDGSSYMLGEGGDWIPIDRYLPAGEEVGQEDWQQMGDSIIEPGALGDSIIEPGALGDAYDNAWSSGRRGGGAVW